MSEQPRSGSGLSSINLLVGTWTGRIILINTVVFAALSLRSGSLFLPETAQLLAFGAKSPVELAHGELWRLLTPVFLHIGLLHFAFNNYFLRVIGNQIEEILGGWWFLAIYLMSGIAGNAASALFTVNLSAGASSALFGLLGSGLYLERRVGRQVQELTGRRPRSRGYLMTVLINLFLGFLLPFVDNAAHVGGLIAGWALTWAMINARRTSLQRPRLALAGFMFAVTIGLIATAAYLGSRPSWVESRLVAAAQKSDIFEEQMHYYSQALAINPGRPALWLRRAEVLAVAGEENAALADIRMAIAHGAAPGDIDTFFIGLRSRGQVYTSERLLKQLQP